jgi:hypothetical protein
LLSPSEKKFLAIKQEDGVDGKNWTVYDASGKARWKGYAETTVKVDGADSVVSTFDHPQWNNQGELTASFVCAFAKVHGAVTLIRSPSSDLNWHGHMKC